MARQNGDVSESNIARPNNDVPTQSFHAPFVTSGMTGCRWATAWRVPSAGQEVPFIWGLCTQVGQPMKRAHAVWKTEGRGYGSTKGSAAATCKSMIMTMWRSS